MTERQTLQWIHDNLGQYITAAVAGTIYPANLIEAMTYRETGFLINRYVGQGKKPEEIHALMKGDYGQRPGETKKQYHGFGYMQIDIKSFPAFVASGKWKEPLALYQMAVSVLESKRLYLNSKGVTDLKAIVAAYNTGEGNVWKSIQKGRDVDYTTHQRNYSKEVWRLMGFINQ